MVVEHASFLRGLGMKRKRPGRHAGFEGAKESRLRNVKATCTQSIGGRGKRKRRAR